MGGRTQGITGKAQERTGNPRHSRWKRTGHEKTRDRKKNGSKKTRGGGKKKRAGREKTRGFARKAQKDGSGKRRRKNTGGKCKNRRLSTEKVDERAGDPFPVSVHRVRKRAEHPRANNGQVEMGRAKEPAEKGEQETKAVDARDRQPCRQEKRPVTVRAKRRATEGQYWQKKKTRRQRPGRARRLAEGELYIVQSV